MVTPITKKKMTGKGEGRTREEGKISLKSKKERTSNIGTLELRRGFFGGHMK